MSKAPAAIQTTDLSHLSERVASFRDVTLEVRQGETFCLLGPVGAGKRTLLRVLAGLLRPTAGSATVAGYDTVRESHLAKLSTGLVPQADTLAEGLSLEENLWLMGKAYHMRPPLLGQRIRALRGSLDLEQAGPEAVRGLPQDLRTRLNLALALVHDPPIVLLDSPGLGLAPQGRQALREYIKALRPGKTIFLATHDSEDAESLADRVAFMEQGKLVAMGTPQEFRARLKGDLRTIVATGYGFIPSVAAGLHHRFAHVQEIEGRWLITHSGLTVEDLLSYLQREGVALRSIAMHEPSLDYVFFSLTGSQLR